MAARSRTLRIALASDHAGFPIKQKLFVYLSKRGFHVIDFGTHSDQSTDYPDFAKKVAQAVSSKKCDKGILACGSGVGMSIAANKFKGIRAAAPWSIRTAKLSSEHNWSNVLCVSGRFHSLSLIKKLIQAWLKTPGRRGGGMSEESKRSLNFESNL